jgi:hypothetical protein
MLGDRIANYVTDAVKNLGGIGPMVLFVLAVVGGIALMVWTWFRPTTRDDDHANP